MKPHPRDEETKALIDHYESIAVRIEKEMKEWEAMLASVKSLDAESETMGFENSIEAFCEPLAASVLDTERELAGWNKGLLEIDSWIQSFEFKVKLSPSFFFVFLSIFVFISQILFACHAMLTSCTINYLGRSTTKCLENEC